MDGGVLQRASNIDKYIFLSPIFFKFLNPASVNKKHVQLLPNKQMLLGYIQGKDG